jgi:GNAT superfamily N-acetyltransferase
MNRRQVEIDENPKEAGMTGLVHEVAGQIRGQGTHIDGQVSIRVATPRDHERLRGMFSRTSSETIYRRFHMPYPNVPGWMLALMLDADHHDKEALVAVAEGEIVGHAMCVRLGDGSEAEVAIIVEDRWQSKGVGKLLLSELAERARLRDIEFFTGEVLGQNRRMLGLVDAVFTDSRHEITYGAFRFRAPLRTLKPTDHIRTLRRAA